MSLFITTQSYKNDTPTEFGYLLKINKNTGEIINKKKINTPIKKNNEERIKPGLRGISFFKSNIYVASWNNIFVLDISTLEIKKILSHKWMSDLHGIFVDKKGIWVTSSLPDAVILYDFTGNPISSLWLPETSLYKAKEIVDKSVDWRFRGKDFRGFKEYHANHVEVKDNSVYITGRGKGNIGGRIIKLNKDAFFKKKHLSDRDVKIFAQKLHGPHDGILDNDKIWITETLGSTIACLNKWGKVIKRKKIFESENHKTQYLNFREFIFYQIKKKLFKRPDKKMSHWTRGLSIDEKHIYVGQSSKAEDSHSRARIIKLDKKKMKIINCFYLTLKDFPETRIFQIYQLKNSSSINE